MWGSKRQRLVCVACCGSRCCSEKPSAGLVSDVTMKQPDLTVAQTESSMHHLSGGRVNKRRVFYWSFWWGFFLNWVAQEDQEQGRWARIFNHKMQWWQLVWKNIRCSPVLQCTKACRWFLYWISFYKLINVLVTFVIVISCQFSSGGFKSD